ncbi:phospholipase a2 domain-containing protein [Phthorimaea operculella]|nr:phospholipase a2 domain-containing protein [Phthorimaea operculella]
MEFLKFFGFRRRDFETARFMRNACLIVCLVPSVLCQDWSRALSFDEIYNETTYVQLQQKTRPYNIVNTSHSHSLEDDRSPNHRYNLEDSRGNEIEIDYDYETHETPVRGFSKEPLLVGFSHDPYRYSVPEEDYLKGVRNMNPKAIISKEQNRGKRGVLHLYNMMYCATGCEPLAYKGYGCYCGFLGSGRPTDGIDRCCKMHDECYENIYCPFFTVYFQPYYWKCYKGQPLCAKENYHTQHQFINGCAARLCECDRKFAMCVKRYPCPRRRALCHSSPLRLLQNLLMFR